MSRSTHRLVAAATLCSVWLSPFAISIAQPPPRGGPPGANAPGQMQPMDARPITPPPHQAGNVPQQHLGPLDPGPLPQAPGWYSRRAIDLNYRQTPLFGRGYGPVGGYGAYGANGPGYYPGVYPYYDAQEHLRWYEEYKRERQLRGASEAGRGDGLEAFAAGDYETAAIRLLGAAELDAGDAASRVHAGHALFALGRYDDAHAVLRRAFELQPTLAYARFDPHSDYGHKPDFNKHLATLRGFADKNPQDPSAAAVLGYMVFYTGGTSAARPLLENAAKLSPDDSLVGRLLAVAARASWNPRVVNEAEQKRRPYDALGVRAKERVPYDVEQRERGDSGPYDSAYDRGEEGEPVRIDTGSRRAAPAKPRTPATNRRQI